MSDGEYSVFQRELLSEPVKGDVIQGTGGLRKIRVAVKGKGKRGGLELFITTSTDIVASIYLPCMPRMKCQI